MPTAGRAQKLHAYCPSINLSAGSVAFIFRKNGTDTALACSLNGRPPFAPMRYTRWIGRPVTKSTSRLHRAVPADRSGNVTSHCTSPTRMEPSTTPSSRSRRGRRGTLTIGSAAPRPRRPPAIQVGPLVMTSPSGPLQVPRHRQPSGFTFPRLRCQPERAWRSRSSMVTSIRL